MLAIIFCWIYFVELPNTRGSSQEYNKKDLARCGELDSKTVFNARIQEVNKNPSTFILLFPTRYFFLSLQGTYGKSLILKAQKIDKLPTDKRDLEIQSWRSRQRPVPIPGEGQCTHRPVPPAPKQDFRASTPKSSSPHKWKCKEDWALHGEKCSRDHLKDHPCPEDSSAKLSSREYPLLGPSMTMASGAYSSKKTDEYRPSSKGSHRRSQSSLTIWMACRNLYKLRGSHSINSLINTWLFLFMEERIYQSPDQAWLPWKSAGFKGYEKDWKPVNL